jgi:hypothetical protein
MSQSYGNLSISPILAATDEIMGVSRSDQLLGTSISQKTSGTLPVAKTISLELDSDGVSQSITVSGPTVYDVASSIQTQVRLLTPIGAAPLAAFVDFTCRYDQNLGKYILSSGTAGTTTSKCIITAGSALPMLKLGPTQGGTEAYAGAEVITWNVKYRFVFEAGRYFGGAIVEVLSSDMSIPTDTAELLIIANRRAAQMSRNRLCSFLTRQLI